jgi:hypothetical protein
MAKVTGPLQSFRARGRFAGILDFREYPAGRVQSARCYIQPPKSKPTGAAQAGKESAVSLCSKLWRTMTAEQQLSWERFAFDYSKYGAEYVWRPEQPPYQKFMSFNLKRCAAGLTPFKMFVPQGWLNLTLGCVLPGFAPVGAFRYCSIVYIADAYGAALSDVFFSPGAGSLSYSLDPK